MKNVREKHSFLLIWVGNDIKKGSITFVTISQTKKYIENSQIKWLGINGNNDTAMTTAATMAMAKKNQTKKKPNKLSRNNKTWECVAIDRLAVKTVDILQFLWQMYIFTVRRSTELWMISNVDFRSKYSFHILCTKRATFSDAIVIILLNGNRKMNCECVMNSECMWEAY